MLNHFKIHLVNIMQYCNISGKRSQQDLLIYFVQSPCIINVLKNVFWFISFEWILLQMDLKAWKQVQIEFLIFSSWKVICEIRNLF